jgi:hypothetical protein
MDEPVCLFALGKTGAVEACQDGLDYAQSLGELTKGVGRNCAHEHPSHRKPVACRFWAWRTSLA